MTQQPDEWLDVETARQRAGLKSGERIRQLCKENQLIYRRPSYHRIEVTAASLDAWIARRARSEKGVPAEVAPPPGTHVYPDLIVQPDGALAIATQDPLIYSMGVPPDLVQVTADPPSGYTLSDRLSGRGPALPGMVLPAPLPSTLGGAHRRSGPAPAQDWQRVAGQCACAGCGHRAMSRHYAGGSLDPRKRNHGRLRCPVCRAAGCDVDHVRCHITLPGDQGGT